jgi:hypothetical protein
VRATPVFAFFDLDGKLVARYTGATRDATSSCCSGAMWWTSAYQERHLHQVQA